MFTLNALKLFLIILAMPMLLIAELKLPYLNKALSPEVRVEDLMERMTIKEKVGQMCQYVGFNYLARSNKGMTAEQILNSDSEAVYKGYNLMIISSIESAFREFKKSNKQSPLLIISGGYGAKISKQLSIKNKFEPNLVIKSIGLISDSLENI